MVYDFSAIEQPTKHRLHHEPMLADVAVPIRVLVLRL